MATFVLIPGAWHGAWCWERVAPLLAARGHRVSTPELPGTASDPTDPRRATLERWAAHVVSGLAQESEPAVLVGHSRGGIVVSRAAELAPERVARLVYVSGYLLPAGRTLADAARADADSLIAPNMIPARGGITCTLRASVVRAALYGRCAAPDADAAAARLTPEPLKPLVTPLEITAARFGRVPREYVACSADRAVTPAAQRAMLADLPCERVRELDADHSPFLSCAEELVALLAGS